MRNRQTVFSGPSPWEDSRPQSGSLWLSKPLTEHGFDYHAADLYRECEPIPGMHFRRVDMNQPLPYETAAFDYIACVEGIEHAENTHHLLREFARVLRPGGKLMITTPNVLSFKSRVRYLLRGTFFGFRHICEDVKPGDHLHINPVTVSTLRFAARRSGLRFEEAHRFPVRSKNWIYLPFAACLFLITRLSLYSADKSAEYKDLHRLLVSLNILLSEVLVVSFVRQCDP